MMEVPNYRPMCENVVSRMLFGAICGNNGQITDGDVQMEMDEEKFQSYAYIVDHSDPYQLLFLTGHLTMGQLLEVVLRLEPSERRIICFNYLMCKNRGNISSVLGRMAADIRSYVTEYTVKFARLDFGPQLTLQSYEQRGFQSVVQASAYHEEVFQHNSVLRDLLQLDRFSAPPPTLEWVEMINLRYKAHIEATAELPTAREIIRQHYGGWYGPLYKSIQYAKFPRELLLSCLCARPNNVVQAAVESGEEFRLEFIGVHTMAYLLGLPLEFDYQREVLKEKIKLIASSPESEALHFENIAKKNQAILEAIISEYLQVTDVKCEVVNTEDLKYEEVQQYPTFDILHYIDEKGHIFQFTRPEFTHLAEKRTNPNTNRKLLDGLISTVIHRLRIANAARLPPSSPMPQLWAETLQPQTPLQQVLPSMLKERENRNNQSRAPQVGGMSIVMPISAGQIVRMLSSS